ncbi:MAG: protocatechuate 3,4-dioxygenase subunit alpha, partial [Candidatus Dormibacteraeota bacterium]|nr:protocatechuate 3,4-dioxygenase subunit alpha [Candidatus Dormibacteraeota bacterium]
DGLLEVWHGPELARCRTDPEGAFHVTLSRPAAGAGQAPHYEVYVFARGLLRVLLTRVYLPDEAAANAADPVLRLAGDGRQTLVAAADGALLHWDVRLQGDRETVFFDWAPAP